jgi:hypothetical protein
MIATLLKNYRGNIYISQMMRATLRFGTSQALSNRHAFVKLKAIERIKSTSHQKEKSKSMYLLLQRSFAESNII